MSAPVIDLKTRKPWQVEPDPIVCIDDDHAHSRLLRSMRNIITDAESLGVSWETLRGWLVSALQFVDFKISLRR